MPQPLASLLRATSRSFHITLWLLPAPVRFQIGLAYLLARTTDTVADSEWLPAPLRLRALRQIRDRVSGHDSTPVDLSPFVGKAVAPTATEEAERSLLLKFEDAVAALRSFSTDDQQRIASVIETITSGQELDLQRFSAASSSNVIGLDCFEDTEDYTYRVAGCVGKFWTEMCQAHLFDRNPSMGEPQLADGIRFGKGLQWVNILRDLPKDLAAGRCYLPTNELRVAGLSASDLKRTDNWPRLKPLYERWVSHAMAHLDAGWSYSQRVPASALRLRMACALPVVLGYRTLQLCRSGKPLDASTRIKVTRSFVRSAFFRCFLTCLGFQRWESLRTWAVSGS